MSPFADGCDQTEEEEVPDGQSDYITGKQHNCKYKYISCKQIQIYVICKQTQIHTYTQVKNTYNNITHQQTQKHTQAIKFKNKYILHKKIYM